MNNSNPNKNIQSNMNNLNHFDNINNSIVNIGNKL